MGHMVRHFLHRFDVGRRRSAELAFLYAVVAVPLLLLICLVSCWPASDGRHDLSGSLFGHDLSQVWVAGRTALDGHASAVYDVASHHAQFAVVFGNDVGSFVWHYPPVFLLVAAALAGLPYPMAVVAWSAGSLLSMAAALHVVLRNWQAVIVAMALPMVVTSLSYGQNGLLTAALLALGLVWADVSPIGAGVLLGATCYKPQLAVLAPLLMIAGGRWRVAAASFGSALGLSLASVALFGIEPWRAFAHSLPETNVVIFKEAWGSLPLNASAFGAVRLLGGSLVLAWLVQAIVAALALAATLAIWLAPAASALRNAVLLAAIPLISPYVPVYDLAVLVPAAAFFVRAIAVGGGSTAMEGGVGLLLFALAIDPRSVAAATHLPCGFALSLGFFILVCSRASGVAAVVRLSASAFGGPHSMSAVSLCGRAACRQEPPPR